MHGFSEAPIEKKYNMNPEIFAKDYSLDSLVNVNPQGHKFSMRVSPRFSNQFSNEYYERFSSRLVKNFVKKCDIFLDVGAHYGFYSLVANEANNHIRIIAVEPIEENFEILKMNLDTNGILPTQLRTVKAAAGSYIGEVDFYKSSASDNCGVFEHPNAASIKKIKVPATTIDEILNNEESESVFIKIDTEGNEFDVLKGMEKVFERYRELSLLIEMNPKMLKLAGTNCKEVLEYLSVKGFKVFGIDEQDSKYYPLDLEENLLRMQETSSYFNVLCIKKEVALSVGFFSHSSALAGAERSLVDLVHDLCERGVLCSVILPNEGPLKNELLKIGASVHVLNGVCSGYQWAIPQTASLAAAKDCFIQSAALIMEQAICFLKMLCPDVIYSQTSVIPWGALCAEILSTPHAWSVCEYGEIDHKLNFYFGFSESVRALYESSDVVFGITQSVKNEVFKNIHVSDDRIHVVYRNVRIGEGAEEASIAKKPDNALKQNIKIGIFGTMHEGKGQEDLIRAGIELLKKGHKVEVHLYGSKSPEYSSRLSSLIESSSFKSSFVIGDFLDKPYAQMRKMDMVVSCARNEAFGRTLIEAVLLKKPIIYADSGGPKEIFVNQEHGLAYVPGDYLGLAEKILAVIHDPERTADRIHKALEYVQNAFTVENYSRKIEFCLRKIKTEGRRQSMNGVQTLLNERISFLFLAQRLGKTINDSMIKLQSRDKELANAGKEITEKIAMLGQKEAVINAISAELNRIYSSNKLKPVIGVTPRRRFNAKWYLTQNPDVAASGMDPYEHYMQFGKSEGRIGESLYFTVSRLSRFKNKLKRKLRPPLGQRILNAIKTTF